MVHKECLVARIRCNGKDLRDYKDGVYLPFNSEYSIVLKNLYSRKALVDVYVDGQTVIEGLILHPSTRRDNTVELERFFENDDSKGHKLKFIEKTDKIRDHRGDNVEDGLVRIIYRFEAEDDPISHCVSWLNRQRGPLSDAPYMWDHNNISYGVSNQSINTSYTSTSASSVHHCASRSMSTNTNEEGITTKGEYSDQTFTLGHIGRLEREEYVIVLPLKGYHTKGQPVEKVTGTRDKIECETCGKRNRSHHRFCSECGTALV